MSALAAAIAKAQSEMVNPPLDGKNPHFKSRFATMAAVRDAVVPCFAKHGVAVNQDTRAVDGGVECMTYLRHGEEVLAFGPTFFPVAKTDAHGIASAYSYAKRYALMGVAVVVGDDDDDGNGATDGGDHGHQQYQRPAPTRQPVEPTSHGTKTTPAGTTGNPKQVYAKWRMDCLTAAQGRKWVNADVALTKIIDGVTNSRNLGSAESWPDNLRSGFLDQIKAGALDTTALRAVTPAAPSIRTLDAGEGPESDNSEGS